MRKILMVAMFIAAALSVSACVPVGYTCEGDGSCDDPLVCCNGYDCYYEADGETFDCSSYDCYQAAQDLSDYCWN